MSLPRLNRWIPIFNWLAAITLVISLAMNFFYAPTELIHGKCAAHFLFSCRHCLGRAVAFLSRWLAVLCTCAKNEIFGTQSRCHLWKLAWCF